MIINNIHMKKFLVKTFLLLYLHRNEKQNDMSTLTITTVKDYNSKQKGAGTAVISKSGELMKRGFMVEFEGEFFYKKTKKEAEAVTVEDFKPEELPVHWNECGMSNDSYLNS